MLLQNPWVVQLQMPRLEKQSTRRPCLTERLRTAGSASSPWHSRSWRSSQKRRPRALQSNAQREAKKCQWPPYKLLKSQRSSGQNLRHMFGHCLPPCFNHRGALHLELLDPKATTLQRNDHEPVSLHRREYVFLSKTRTVDRLTQLCNPTATKSKNNLPPHSAHGQKTHWQGQNDGGQDEKHGKREGKRQ